MTAFRVAFPLLGLAALSSAYDGQGENAVVGSKGPWGLSDNDLQQALGQANATGSVTVPGFNLSSPADSPMDKTQDWTVRVFVRGDVSLVESSASDIEAKADKVTQVTSFSIDAPDSGIIRNKQDANTLCASIAFGLNDKGTKDGQKDAEDDDGECSFLSKECRDDLTRGAADAGSGCGDVAIPGSCNDWISSSVGMESFEMTEKILGANRFFNFGSEPTAEGNKTEYDIAITNIWPVVLSWHHEAGSGDSSTASLRCLRADNVAFDSRAPGTVPDRGDIKESQSDDNKTKDNAGVRGGPALMAGLFVVGVSSLFAML